MEQAATRSALDALALSVLAQPWADVVLVVLRRWISLTLIDCVDRHLGRELDELTHLLAEPPEDYWNERPATVN